MTSSRQRDDRVRQLADALRRRLVHYLPGTRLPNRRKLAVCLNASVRDTRDAVERLADEGLVECHPRGGIFVTEAHVAAPTVQRVVAVAYPFRNAERYQQEILLGADRQCEQRRLTFQAEHIGEGNPSADHLAALVVDDPAVGYMLVNVRPSDKMIRDWRIRSLPFVLVDDYAPNSAVHTVMADLQGGAYRAVDVLALLGHRRIGYAGVVPSPKLPPSLRVLGYRLGMQRHGLEQEGELLALDFSAGSAGTQRALRERLARGNLPTAFVAGDLRIGCDLLAVCGQMGIDVPADLSVTAVGMRRHELPSLVERLSHVDMGEPEQLGRSAVDLLAQFFDAPAPVNLTLGCQWVDCGSVGPPRGG